MPKIVGKNVFFAEPNRNGNCSWFQKFFACFITFRWWRNIRSIVSVREDPLAINHFTPEGKAPRVCNLTFLGNFCRYTDFGLNSFNYFYISDYTDVRTSSGKVQGLTYWTYFLWGYRELENTVDQFCIRRYWKKAKGFINVGLINHRDSNSIHWSYLIEVELRNKQKYFDDNVSERWKR